MLDQLRCWVRQRIDGDKRMATNVIATHLDTKRVTLSDVAEQQITLEATNTLRYLEMQARGGTARVTFSPSGTFSTDNYASIDNGERWRVADVALRCIDASGAFCFARGESSGVILEIIWGQ
jgi:hypothetical protein